MTAWQSLRNSLGCLLLCLASLNAAGDEPSEADIRRLQDEINRLQSQLQDFKGQQSNIQQALRESEIAIGKLARDINTIEGELVRQRDTLASLQERREQLYELKVQQQPCVCSRVFRFMVTVEVMERKI